jgi:putative FmdB family regulatory protein
MPLYDLQCESCGKRETNVLVASGGLSACPNCGGARTVCFKSMTASVIVKNRMSPQEQDVEQMKVILKQAESKGQLSREVLSMRPEDFVIPDTPLDPAQREWTQGEVDRRKLDIEHEEKEIKSQGDALTSAFNALGKESQKEVTQNLDSIVYEPVEATK